MTAVYFSSPGAFRAWLEGAHATETELLVGFFKAHTGRPSLTWPESVDEALCFGWIDGVRRRVDDDRYTIRFTPRRPKSIWSAVNVRRVEVLTRAGRMTAAGLRAFEARLEHQVGVYSYEQGHVAFSPPYDRVLDDDPRARAFFAAQPPSYRRVALWWVMSAKQEETRARRMAELVARSRAGERLPQFVSPTGKRDAPSTTARAKKKTAKKTAKKKAAKTGAKKKAAKTGTEKKAAKKPR